MYEISPTHLMVFLAWVWLIRAVQTLRWIAGQQPASAAARRRLFNPLRSLRKLFGHRRKRLDTDAASPSGSQPAVMPLTLTPDVTTSSSTDVNLGDDMEQSHEPARLREISHLSCIVEELVSVFSSRHCIVHGDLFGFFILSNTAYTVWVKKIPPCGFLKFFPKRMGIF